MAVIMASGGKDRKIGVWCLEPNLSEFESYENLNDRQLVERIGSLRNINIMSPMSSIRGRIPHYYYNQMEVENHATPMGLGMVDGDTVAIWNVHSWNRSSLPPEGKLLQVQNFNKRIINLTSNGDTSSTCPGLNRVIGEHEEGFELPLELVQHSEVCTSRDDVMKLSNAVKDTREYLDARSWAYAQCALNLPLRRADMFFKSYKHPQKSYCLLGLALTRLKIQDERLKSRGFKTICDLLQEMLPWIKRCEEEGYHIHNIGDPEGHTPSPCREMEDIFFCCIPDLATPGTCYRRLLSMGARYRGLAMEWKKMESSVFVGPVRNSTSEDSPVPIVRLVPYTQEATVQELVMAWKHYAEREAMQQYPRTPRKQKKREEFFRREGLHHLIGEYHVTYNDREIDMSSSDLISDVTNKSLSKHYFVISGDDWGDNRDRAEFLESKRGNKDKKNKKKRKDSSRDALERKGEDGQVTSASASGSRGEKSKQDGKYKKSKTREKVIPEANMGAVEKYNLDKNDEGKEETRSSSFVFLAESPIASLKPLMNAAANSLHSPLDPIFDHINACFDDEDNFFFRDLVAMVMEVCLEVNESLVKLNKAKLARMSLVLRCYLYPEKNRELQTLYSIQAIVHWLGHPDKLLPRIFDVLFKIKLISGEAFIQWFESTEAVGERQAGREVALKSCTQFVQWLRSPELEDDPEPVDDTEPKEDSNPDDDPEPVDDPVALNRENTKALEEELAIKEAKLQQIWDKYRDFVESTGREMSLLLSALDDDEDEKHSIQKEVTKLESQMSSIRDQLARHVQDLHEKDVKLNESLKKKRMLEDIIAQEVDANKQATQDLEREIESIKARMEDMNKSKESKTESDTVGDIVDEMKPETQKLLFHINRKIEAKEADLECPVCLEVSRPPIYSCEEQHIICSDCRPKVLH